MPTPPPFPEMIGYIRSLRNIKVEAQSSGDEITVDNLNILIDSLNRILVYIGDNPMVLQDEHATIIELARQIINRHNSIPEASAAIVAEEAVAAPVVRVDAWGDESVHIKESLSNIPVANIVEGGSFHNSSDANTPSNPTENSNYGGCSVQGAPSIPRVSDEDSSLYVPRENYIASESVADIVVSESGGVLSSIGYAFYSCCLYLLLIGDNNNNSE